MTPSIAELGQLSRLQTGNALPQANVGFVKDSSGKELARQLVIKCTPSLAYMVVQNIDKSIEGKDITVNHDDNLHLKFIKIETEKENRRLLPLAQQFHSLADARHAECHLSDVLAAHSLGRFNLELKKNVTIDSFQLIDSWRDDAGFIVTDRNVFNELTFDASKLLSTLSTSTGNIVKFEKSHSDAVADFDQTVCGFGRDDYLDLLFANNSALLAKSGAVDGYIVGDGKRILCLYAETIEIAHSLLRAYIEMHKLSQVVLFSTTGVWECQPIKSRAVYRRHTRSVPSILKWSKIYALNMGAHIV